MISVVTTTGRFCSEREMELTLNTMWACKIAEPKIGRMSVGRNTYKTSAGLHGQPHLTRCSVKTDLPWESWGREVLIGHKWKFLSDWFNQAQIRSDWFAKSRIYEEVQGLPRSFRIWTHSRVAKWKLFGTNHRRKILPPPPNLLSMWASEEQIHKISTRTLKISKHGRKWVGGEHVLSLWKNTFCKQQAWGAQPAVWGYSQRRGCSPHLSEFKTVMPSQIT